jgi:hypothetical protein
VKVAEAVQAVADGATELDLVIDLGLADARSWAAVEAQIAAVRSAVPSPVVLKVIIEASATFTPVVCAPDGNPTTAATPMPGPRACRSSGRRAGARQTAPTPSSVASTQSMVTCVGVAEGARRV